MSPPPSIVGLLDGATLRKLRVEAWCSEAPNGAYGGENHGTEEQLLAVIGASAPEKVGITCFPSVGRILSVLQCCIVECRIVGVVRRCST